MTMRIDGETALRNIRILLASDYPEITQSQIDAYMTWALGEEQEDEFYEDELKLAFTVIDAHHKGGNHAS